MKAPQELSSRKRELLERLLRQQSEKSPARITPRSADMAHAPLSYAQERLWFLERLEPEGAAYTVRFSIRFRSAVDPRALQLSLDEIVRRHEILRTTFPAVDDRPVQRVAEPAAVPLETIDVGPLSAEDRARAVQRVDVREGARSFDLTSGPLLFATLVTGADSGAVLLLTMHHIVIDGWSTGLLASELRVLYEAFAAGKPSPLPALPIQFADYAVWQREWLQGEALRDLTDYWRAQLADAPTLQLPIDHARRDGRGSTSARESVLLDPALSASLKELSRREASTLYMTGLAAFSALLHRYTGQDDIVVGTPVANRRRAETEPLIGFFINMLVMRTRMTARMSFRELLAQVRTVASGAFSHEDLPFEKLVSELAPVRDLNRNPLFQVTFAVNPSVTEADAPFELNVGETHTARFDLEAHISERSDGLFLSLIYDTTLFEPVRVQRMLGHLEVLLRAAAANPDIRIGSLPLLMPAERGELTTDWNATAIAFPRDASVADLVERQVVERPDAIAVEWPGSTLTYAQLNRRANQLAHHLRRHGAVRGSRIGLCIERGADLIVAMLAVLKAGGAYVPLDPDYPLERLAFMLDDTSPPVLLTQRRLASALPSSGARTILLDDDADAIAAEPDENLPIEGGGLDVAYVIYTSGSTGRPKGASIPHRAIVRLVWQANFAALDPTDVVAQASNASFDAATFEIWGALVNGARLVGIPKDVALAPALLARELRRRGATTLFLTTALFNQVAREEPNAFAEMRHVLFGGEAVDPRAVAAVLHARPPQRLLHVYGPTENTTFSTWHDVRAVEHDATTVPIGRAISNSDAYVLDASFELGPAGVPGELFVGGDGLATGYLHQPALTAERFIPSPFGDGARLYRTGDVVRWTVDGQIEFIGRTDEQVKIRGFRIEPGEIEAVLAAHPDVHAAAVIARDSGAGTKRLIAYIVGKKPGRLDVNGVRAHLKSRLPDYMVPSALVEMPALPLNANGKLDRHALPVPDVARSAAEAEPEAPRTESEAALARIWSQVLGLPAVGVHDNFFELGGDSILSIQIVSRANEAGLRLTVKDLFRYQTVAELAAAATTAPAMDVERAPAAGRARLTPIQEWFFEQRFTDAHHFNQAVLLESTERLDPSTITGAVRQLVQHHEALRTRFTETASGWVQEIVEAHELTVAEIDLAQVPAAEQDDALTMEAAKLQASLSLTGPVMRAALFDHGGGQPRRLLLIVHHLAVDAVSWRILVEDLNRACAQIARGETVRLPHRTSSIDDWARRLEEAAQTPAFQAEARVWIEQPSMPGAALPTDHAVVPGANTAGSLAHVSVALSVDETQALLQEAPKAYRTQINDLLLTALAQTLTGWTGQSAVWIDLEGHGREALFDDVDLSRTVGWFTSVFPVCLDVPATGGAVAALKRVKERLRAVPRHGVGYGVLRYMSGDPDIRAALATARTPEISFNYLGRYDQVADDASTWRFSSGSTGPSCSPRGARSHLIDVSGLVAGGALRIDWIYSDRVHERATIERLAAGFAAALRGLIAQCITGGARGATPADFPLVALDQETVDRLCAEYPDLEDICPLSPLQQGLHFHALTAPADGAYVEQFHATFEGDLDVVAMCDAWQLVVDRHPMLRTAFAWRDLDAPVQLILRHAAVPWSVEDWRGVAPDEQTQRVEAQLAAERAAGFDLAVAPAMRFTLAQVADRTYRLTWSFHHILLDGWSLQIVLRDAAEAYAALRSGRQPSFAPAPPFREYLTWLSEQDHAGAEQFWKEMLRGLTGPTMVALPPPERPADGYADRWLELPEALTDQLKAVARTNQLTLSTLVQGAWALLLARYTGQRDIVFGVTVAGRPAGLRGVEAMVGLFINTLPMRVDLSPEQPMTEVLRRLQERQVAMRDHEYARLSDVQRWSGASNGDALFDSLVAFENYPIERAVEQGDGALATRDLRVIEQTHYPLTVVVVPGARLMIRIGYDQRRLDARTADRMAAHLGRIFEQMAAAPVQQVADIDILDEEERQQLAGFEAGSRGGYDRDATIPGLFARQAAARPAAVALSGSGGQITYADLDRRSNQLARALRAQGIRADVAVGVCLEPGVDTIVALLAVLKAGGGYLALDASYPAARLRWMIDEVGAPVVITQASLCDRFEKVPSVLCVDLERDAIARQSTAPVAAEITGDHLAYVCYTSGSTGQPKGVAVPHRAVARLLFGVDYVSLGPDETWLQLAPVPFDASTLEIWGALLHGGRLVVTNDRMPTPQALGALLSAERVTSLWLTASLYNTVVDASPEALAGVRQLVIGGEALSPAHVQRGLTALPDTRIVNGYGPTEGTTFTCCYPIPASSAGALRPVPIGRPIGNTSVYVLDAAMRRVPIGVPGELYIGGDGLARGYLAQPARTAERFVPSPFDDVPGGRLYRTGDVVRWAASGVIGFIGRNDSQVKIRGFRIELGEIETALHALPGVRAAAVIARQDVPGTKRLVAYIVPAGAAAPSEDTLRDHLRARLPEYMVPSAFVMLAQLPLTRNGKIDRDALPAPEAQRASVSRAPATAAEVAIAAIWSEVIGVGAIGLDDNFFELGGDSILGIQICSRAQRAGFAITPKQLFEHQTVGTLAAVAGQRVQRRAADAAVTGPVALLPAQHWWLEQQPVDAHHFNLAVALEVAQSVTPDILERALAALVVHHDALRARFSRTSTGWRQHIADCDGTGAGSLSRIDLRGVPYEARAAEAGRALAALQASLDLAQGPVVRAALIEFDADQPSQLILIAHHLVVDTVSWRILIEDLGTACLQILDGQTPRLTAKTSSVRQWADRLASYARTEAIAAAGEWWRASAAAPVPLLPLDHEHSESLNMIGAAASIDVPLSAADTKALLQDVPKVYHTQINDVLLTALLLAVTPWTDSPVLAVTLEGHGRDPLFDDVDVARTVGWFTSLAPIRLTLSSSDDLGAALCAVKEQLRGVPGGITTYGALRYLESDASLRATLATAPAPQISFNYLGQYGASSADEASPVRTIDAAVGPMISPRQRRRHLLDVAGFVADGRLQMKWVYCPQLHTQATVSALAQRYVAALRRLIAHCASASESAYTPSDFPLARLDQRALSDLGRRFAEQKIEDVYPASPLQQGMVFHALATPASGLFVTQLDCELQGDIDLPAMRRAWEGMLERHPVLRTAFTTSGTEAIHQVVLQHVALPWLEEDWRTSSDDDQGSRLAAWLREDRRRGFDVTTPPLLRITLIRMAADCCHMVWTHHHSLLDGWSFPILLQELFESYHALHDGAVPKIARRPSYREYIAWLQRQDRGAVERYWRETFRGFAEPTVLAVDRAPGLPPSDVETADEQRLQLSDDATAAIEAFAQRHHLTLNTVVQGAWALLLSRYSEQDDVVFGATVSGRPAELPGVEQMIGLFINGLPMRARLAPGDRVADWLRTLQAQNAGMRQYEWSALTDIQGWTDVPRGTPLFETTFVFENYPEDAGLRTAAPRAGLVGAQVVSNTSSALHLRVVPGARLTLRIVHDVRRYDAETVTRMLAQLESVVGQFTTGADLPLDTISLVTVSDAPRLPNPAEPLSTEWNGAAHEQFAARASAMPGRVAVVDAMRSWTYGELDRRANQIAQHLVASGIRREEVVAIYGDRSAALVLAVLGAAKAGAAFLLLDPAYPAARHVEYLRAANARAFIETAPDAAVPPELREHLDGAHLRCRLQLPAESVLDRHASTAVPLEFRPDDLAYIAFTSGSAGRPKGILGRHGPLARYAGWFSRTFAIGEADRLAMLSAIPHDPLLRDIFPPLQIGSTLCIPDATLMGMPGRLIEWMRAAGITSCNLTPALAKLLTEGASVPVDTLRYAFVVGETLTPRDVEMLRQIAPGVTCVNLYGSTEAQQSLAYYALPNDADPDGSTRVPIGRGMDGVQLLVLTKGGLLAGVGEVGEICVRTPHLARGYLGDHERTRTRFQENPFTGHAGDRLYRTGDRGRYLSNGDVQFIGRRDGQVKIRGFRIEPGEVEAALMQHPGVREVAVVPSGGDRDARVLVAYVAGTAAIPDMRERLASRLPAAYVPAHFVVLDRLPRTATGKIDRLGLPAPEREVRTEADEQQSPIEQTVAGFWTALLNVDRVNVHDNFFDLGGHSLLAARVAARIRDEFQIELSIAAVFRHPTVRALSLAVTQALLESNADLAQLLEEVRALPEGRLQELIDDEESGASPASLTS